MRHAYPTNLEWEPDGSAVTVTFDDLPGATFGATEADALARAEDLLATGLSFYTDETLPTPMPAASLSNAGPARRLGPDEKAMRRVREVG